MWSRLFTIGVYVFAAYGVFSALACIVMALAERRERRGDDHWHRINNRTDPPAV